MSQKKAPGSVGAHHGGQGNESVRPQSLRCVVSWFKGEMRVLRVVRGLRALRGLRGRFST